LAGIGMATFWAIESHWHVARKETCSFRLGLMTLSAPFLSTVMLVLLTRRSVQQAVLSPLRAAAEPDEAR
jgi:hypothetical protein